MCAFQLKTKNGYIIMKLCYEKDWKVSEHETDIQSR